MMRPMSATTSPRTWDDLPVRHAEQKAWYWYEWAQSAFVTTVSVVLALPYLTSIANNAAGCTDLGSDDTCSKSLHVLGVSVSPGSAVF